MEKAEQIRDVYAHFGLAMYLAQCLEQSIFIHLMFFDFFPRNVPLFKSPALWQQEFDRYETQELGRTMGMLIRKLKDNGQPTSDVQAVLDAALKQRNRLAHKYFAEQAVPFMSKAGRDSMIVELQSIQDTFRCAAEMVDAITMPVARRYGFTEEMQRKSMEELMSNGGKTAG